MSFCEESGLFAAAKPGPPSAPIGLLSESLISPAYAWANLPSVVAHLNFRRDRGVLSLSHDSVMHGLNASNSCHLRACSLLAVLHPIVFTIAAPEEIPEWTSPSTEERKTRAASLSIFLLSYFDHIDQKCMCPI